MRRSCGYGEIFEQLSTGSVVCTVCAAGFYALELGATVCNSCPENTDCPGGNTLDMDEGFWRVNEFSSEVLKCPVQKSCLGGSNVAEQCRSGHTGMYCDVCEEGYVHGADGSCSGCEAESFVVVAVVIPVIAFFVLVLFVVVTIHSERIKAYLSAQILILADKAEQMNLSSLRTKVKIMITFIQILSQMPNVFGALFPSGFLTFLDIFGFFNLNIINFLSLGCIIESNYHSDLLTATVGPMLLTVIVALSLFFKKIFTRDSFNPYHMAELRKDMLTAVLIISFCIFSPVSITIFQAFSCEPFDDGSNMLVADYSINCNSQTHKNYEIYAGLMILIYPIGIPISYLYLLVKNHQYVNPSAALVVREDEKRLVDRRIIQAEKSKLRETYKEIWHLSFLYENYAPKRWYFEVLDCFRRLFMTAIPVLILRGTTEQLLLVLMASLVWCIIYMQLKPFEMPNDNNIAIMSQWAISFTLIGGVMLKVGEDSRNAQYYVLDVLLVLINATVILSTIYIAAMVDDDDILADLAKDAKRQKVKYGNGNDSDDDSVYKKGAHEIVELPIAHKKTTAEHSVSTENPIHSEQVPNNPNSSDVKPNRRASALGSQLFGTAQLKRASAVNFETESLSHTPVENAETKTATKRGSVLDRLRGKKSKRSSKIDKTGPDSDDDETPPSNSFSAKVGGPNVSDSTVGNHSLFAAHINAAGKRPKNKEDGVDSDDEDY